MSARRVVNNIGNLISKIDVNLLNVMLCFFNSLLARYNCRYQNNYLVEKNVDTLNSFCNLARFFKSEFCREIPTYHKCCCLSFSSHAFCHSRTSANSFYVSNVLPGEDEKNNYRFF